MVESGLYSGLSSRKRGGGRFGLIFFIALSFVLIVLSRNAAEASVFEKARAGVADAARPLLELIAGPIGLVGGVLGDVSDYFGVMEENRQLKEERDELLRWKARAIALEQRLTHVQKLANMSVEPEMTFQTARVVGDSEGPFVRAMIVNAGGVDRGQAVVDEFGLVGHIIAPGRVSSRILLVTDLNSRIPVFVEGAEASAVLAGDNSSRPRLKFLKEEDVIAVGQRVITSGDGGVLPRGLPVGVVSSVREGEPRVKPFVDFDRTEFVRILNYEFPMSVDPAPVADETDPDASASEGAEATRATASAGALTQPQPAAAAPQTPVEPEALGVRGPVQASAAAASAAAPLVDE
ncbi:MAG: rod shape-determining protein MreC [Pseudomonadota bacterium]